MHQLMVSGCILTSSLGLFAAVTTVYLMTWYGTHDPAMYYPQDGHISLIVNHAAEIVTALK